MSANFNLIKANNLNKVRSELKSAGNATKSQLSELTGLSVVTINSLVNALIDTGEVLPDSLSNFRGGRPAASFSYNSKFIMALAIYMHEFYGQDTVYFCAVDLRGEVIERVKYAMHNITIESFDTGIETFMRKFPQIKALCIGIPGVEVNNSLIISDYKHTRGFSLSGHIRDKFHLPVIVENDVNAAVLGYCRRNNITDDKCVIGLYFPDKYPPGAGIYLNGKIYRGKNGLAGEIKYLPLGIDWETFDHNPPEKNEIVIKSIQAAICMYNPDRIVLYSEFGKNEAPEIINKKFDSMIEKIMLPEIISSTDLNGDFEAGMEFIALSMIVISA